MIARSARRRIADLHIADIIPVFGECEYYVSLTGIEIWFPTISIFSAANMGNV